MFAVARPLYDATGAFACSCAALTRCVCLLLLLFQPLWYCASCRGFFTIAFNFLVNIRHYEKNLYISSQVKFIFNFNRISLLQLSCVDVDTPANVIFDILIVFPLVNIDILWPRLYILIKMPEFQKVSPSRWPGARYWKNDTKKPEFQPQTARKFSKYFNIFSLFSK